MHVLYFLLCYKIRLTNLGKTYRDSVHSTVLQSEGVREQVEAVDEVELLVADLGDIVVHWSVLALAFARLLQLHDLHLLLVFD